MEKLPETLRDNVRLLGELLGQTLLEHEGPELFRKVEEIRAISKILSTSGNDDYEPLLELLGKLNDKDVLPITRSFNQFLNLANIADQQYYASAPAEGQDNLDILLSTLSEQKKPEELLDVLSKLNISLVLTAHPTEVTRRTIIRKYDQISRTVGDLSRDDLLQHEKDKLKGRLRRLIEEMWSTDELRSTRPTAVDEAKWGFAVIENSLWSAVPDFLCHLDRLSHRRLGQHLPLNFAPFQFFSWMGGDRDGNPNVTSKVTEEVILLGRWKAAELYLHEVENLGGDLSMAHASSTLTDVLENPLDTTPYRTLLKDLRERLKTTIEWTAQRVGGEQLTAPSAVISHQDDLLTPLLLAYESLLETKLDYIARGPLSDLIRRVYAFGVNLVPLDIRQDGERHVSAIDELTMYLGLGSYKEWNEQQRQAFLLEQLDSKRPILPLKWPASDDTREVLDTCQIIAQQPKQTLSHYVISMAQQPSDVLAVALLLKESGLEWNMPIVPLFETLDDLDRSSKVMDSLWQMPWYQQYTGGHQTVMIGYSDSAKDAGKLAATWAQYKSQESLVDLAEQYQIELTLFHGRGGTVGRGGGPVEKAMASQPPGSVKGRIRVTEQGEMIRYKFGMPRVAFTSLSTYVTATLKATVTPAPAPCAAWRELIEAMSQESLKAYRSVVRESPAFVPYFRSLTPEQELGKLAIGSRPAKRKATGGVESLRAIPWVFAWMQVRLNLPSWLGTLQALKYGQQHQPELLVEMTSNWAFFSSFLDLLEMVVGKADVTICNHYEQRLVDEQWRGLGKQLRAELIELGDVLNQIKNQDEILSDDPTLQRSLQVRKPYIDPLNYLQAELLRRDRSGGHFGPELDRALQITMAGISAGMRNTG